MFVSLLLLLVSIVALYFFISPKTIPNILISKQFVPLVFNDKVSLVDISGLRKEYVIKKILDTTNASKLKDGGVEGVYLTVDKVPVGLRKFIEILEGGFIPGDQDLVEDNFLIGIVKNKSQNNELASQNIFILLKTRYIADIFDALKDWEKKMFLDLHGFFGVEISPETKYLLTKEFEDDIVENKNARILYDKERNIIMMYVFADDNSVVVANSRDATREIIQRLASSSVSK